jgi:hypothetical protein
MDRIEQHPDDLAALQRAFALLESPSIVAKLTNIVGKPLESALGRLPDSAGRRVHSAVQGALSKSVRVALSSLRDTPSTSASTRSHTLMSAASGAAGGFPRVRPPAPASRAHRRYRRARPASGLPR